MRIEEVKVKRCGRPFPIYPDPARTLLEAYESDRGPRNETVAHILALAAGYAYADIDTMSMMMGRIGFAESTTRRFSETVDAMFIDSTAYLTQSRCGRVAILSYRGTEVANLVNWIGDTDVASASMRIGRDIVSVHGGFFRNLRATRLPIVEELHGAFRRGMEALYVTGHSLGGALAVLFALSISEELEVRAIAKNLRAVYTFGQPMTVGGPLPAAVRNISRKIFRHVLPRDIVPFLPPAGWGDFVHVGHEYRHDNGGWHLQDAPAAPLVSLRDLPRAFATALAPLKRRGGSPYSVGVHGPQHYISALRPPGLISEFGDDGQ